VYENLCPRCDASLPVESINIQEGVALCPGCGVLSRLREVVDQTRPSGEILSQRPRGCTIEEGDQEIFVEASLRSASGFFGALFLCLFWNGIVSVFVLIAISGLYRHLIGPIPAWFPAPEMEGGDSLGMTLFLCVFLIPFVTIGAFLIGTVLTTALGAVQAVVRDELVLIRTGIGRIAWTKRFDPRRYRQLTVTQNTKWQNNNQPTVVIEIIADETVQFGSMLTSARRDWMAAVLKEMLSKPKENWRKELWNHSQAG
jgi:hypothetical protein